MKDELQEVLIEELQNDTEIDTQEVCNKLLGLRSFRKVEFDEEYNWYKLWTSAHLTSIANKDHISWPESSLILRVKDNVSNVINEYYEKDSYELNLMEDYAGYWYVILK